MKTNSDNRDECYISVRIGSVSAARVKAQRLVIATKEYTSGPARGGRSSSRGQTKPDDSPFFFCSSSSLSIYTARTSPAIFPLASCASAFAFFELFFAFTRGARERSPFCLPVRVYATHAKSLFQTLTRHIGRVLF